MTEASENMLDELEDERVDSETGSNDDVSLGTIFKGSIPYWIMMLIIMSLVYLFPELASWPTKFV